MGARADEARSELLRVRRDIQMVEEQLARATHELDEAAKVGDRERVDDHRRMRNCLWKEKEQLRIQETIFLKIAFADFPPPNMAASPGSHAFSSAALPSPLHLQHQGHMAPHATHFAPPPLGNPPLAASSLSGSPSLMGAGDPSMTPMHTSGLIPATSPPDCFSLGGPSPSPLQTSLTGPGGPVGMAAHGGGGNLTHAGMSAGQSLLGMLPTSPAMRPMAGTPGSGGGGRVGRRRSSMSPGLAPMQGGAMLMGGGGDMADVANPDGYEVSRNLDARVEDVWREWKEGINGGPSIEKLEEARRRDRKCIWWRHKNDYKYWRKQMRIVHAVESKAGEFQGDVAAALRFWDDILRVEFAGSISKLREALGGDRPLPSAQAAASGAGANGADDSPGAGEGRGEDGREGSGEGIEGGGGGVGGAGEGSKWKRQRRELLQRGVERMKAWGGQGAGSGAEGSALMTMAPGGVAGVCAEGSMGGGMGGGMVMGGGSLTGALVEAMGTPVGMGQQGMAQQQQGMAPQQQGMQQAIGQQGMGQQQQGMGQQGMQQQQQGMAQQHQQQHQQQQGMQQGMQQPMQQGMGQQGQANGVGGHMVGNGHEGVAQGMVMQHTGNGMQPHAGGNGMQAHAGGNGMHQHPVGNVMQQHVGANGMQQQQQGGGGNGMHGGGQGMQQQQHGGNGMQQHVGEQHMVGGHGDGSAMQGHVQQQHVMQVPGGQHVQPGMVQQM